MTDQQEMQLREKLRNSEPLPCTWPQGRPTLYHSGLCEELVTKMKQGLSNVRIASEWGISEQTFYNWLRDNNEFEEAYTVGKTAWEAWWEEFGYKLMTGEQKGDFKAWIAYMNRKFGWSGTNPSSQGGSTINIGNMNVLSMDKKEIDKKLAQFMEKYGATTIQELEVKVHENEE